MSSRVALLLLLAASSCRREGDENLGLAARRRTVEVDLRALTRPGELERVVGMPSAEVTRRLGAHRLIASTRLILGAGESGETLEETFRLEVDAKGGSHLLHDNSRGYGREAIASDGTYYARPRYGRFVRRSPEGDEVERARDEVQGTLGGYLAVLGRFASRSGGGTVDRGGRRAVKILLTLAGSPAPLRDPDPQHAWRETIAVESLAGEVLVDEKTGAPLRAVLDAKYRSRRGERAISVGLHYESDVEALGAVTEVAPPEGALPSPTRARPLVDRQILLDGLATGGRGAPRSDEDE